MPRKIATLAAHDPREEQDWFQRLPTHAREELRAGWLFERGQWEAKRSRARQRTIRYLVEAAVVFGVVEALFTTRPSVTHLILAVVAGVTTGGVARALLAGSWLYGAIALVVYCFFSGLTLGTVELTNTMVCVFLCFAAGRMHQLQRGDGSE